MGAAPPHRFALHRRRRGSWAPLLLIASLCIVAGAVHGAILPARLIECCRSGRSSLRCVLGTVAGLR
ncbi:MAG: hypothetical protein F6Q13_05460 [Mycobacterium sp.]|nr:MAG: hypothetical protein F6Q13_05460 [Mycobacterium sp.]